MPRRLMDRRQPAFTLLSLVLAFVFLLGIGDATPQAEAAPPWSNFVTFKRIEAKQGESYPLGEEHGPWLILATTFRGDNAERDARDLVYELRKEFKLNAYTHRKSYDYSQSFVGRGVDKYGNPVRMRHQNGERFDEVAVLIGDFTTIDDPKAAKALKRIKTMRPRALDPKGEQETSQSFAAIRRLHNRVWNRNDAEKKGPMRMAFVIPNPQLPKSYFRPKGVDKFVEQLNEDRPYSLLTCDKAYTVRVATFSGGKLTKSQQTKKFLKGNMASDRLDQAAKSADRLANKLRDVGVEAYVFHDRDQSVVTVGSFNSLGAQRMADGTIRYNPSVQAVINDFSPLRPGAAPVQHAGFVQGRGRAQWRNQVYDAEIAEDGYTGLSRNMRYRTFDGTPFDLQPTVIDVPRRSIARDYAGLPNLFR